MTTRYPLRPKTGSMVLGALFFGVGAVVLLMTALTNDRGLVINGLLHLGPGGARVLYGVLAAASLGFVAIAVIALLAYRKNNQEVIVDDEGITTPGPLWRLRVTRTARFADVTALRDQTVYGQRILTLVTPTRNVSIAKSHLPDGAFDEIAAFVRARVTAPPASAPKAR